MNTSNDLEAHRVPTTPGSPMAALVALFLAIPLLANAAESKNCNHDAERKLLRQGTTTLTIENDLFAKSDRQYTNGIKLGLVTPTISAEERTNCLFEWAQGLNDLMFAFAPSTRNAPITLSLTLLGQDMYTPEIRVTPKLIKNDRPYAAWLYVGYGVNARIDDSLSPSSELHSVELQLGVVGPWARGKEAQDFIHRAFGYDLFLGWGNQLKNEPAFLYHYEYKYKPRSVFSFGSSAWGWSTIHHVGVSAGTVSSYVNAGIAFRIGRNIPDDFGTSPIRPRGNNSAPLASPGVLDNKSTASGSKRLGRDGISAHLYLSLDARLVANNIFLDGNTFRDSHSGGHKRFVTDAAFGGVIIGHCWKVGIGRVIRSKEFDLQPHSQKYGSILVSFEDGYFDSLFGIRRKCDA